MSKDWESFYKRPEAIRAIEMRSEDFDGILWALGVTDYSVKQIEVVMHDVSVPTIQYTLHIPASPETSVVDPYDLVVVRNDFIVMKDHRYISIPRGVFLNEWGVD